MGVLGWGGCCLSLDDAAVNYCYQLKFVWICAFVFSASFFVACCILLLFFFLCSAKRGLGSKRGYCFLPGPSLSLSLCHPQIVWFCYMLYTQTNTHMLATKSFLMNFYVIFFICWDTGILLGFFFFFSEDSISICNSIFQQFLCLNYCRKHELHHAKLNGEAKTPCWFERLGLLCYVEIEWRPKVKRNYL